MKTVVHSSASALDCKNTPTSDLITLPLVSETSCVYAANLSFTKKTWEEGIRGQVPSLFGRDFIRFSQAGETQSYLKHTSNTMSPNTRVILSGMVSGPYGVTDSLTASFWPVTRPMITVHLEHHRSSNLCVLHSILRVTVSKRACREVSAERSVLRVNRWAWATSSSVTWPTPRKRSLTSVPR